MQVTGKSENKMEKKNGLVQYNRKQNECTTRNPRWVQIQNGLVQYNREIKFCSKIVTWESQRQVYKKVK